tara:strand:- start:9 stop:167 length:159 start_codon:yes stop_codon:yes gene_type:complete
VTIKKVFQRIAKIVKQQAVMNVTQHVAQASMFVDDSSSQATSVVLPVAVVRL